MKRSARAWNFTCFVLIRMISGRGHVPLLKEMVHWLREYALSAAKFRVQRTMQPNALQSEWRARACLFLSTFSSCHVDTFGSKDDGSVL